ncbi:MAG: DUF4349 domain-containing protein [Chloroflexota bacterium]
MAVRTMLLAALALILMVVAACGGGSAAPPSRGAQDLKDSAGSATSTGSSVPSPTGEVDRLIVRTVNFNMLVKDVAETVESVASIARAMGGFVLSSQVSGEEESRYGYISIRVPAEQTDAALAQLRGLAVRVETERSSAQDVTEEYVDLQSNLKNLEATEEQYLSLMKRATTVEDTLKVQKELTSVQGQIEQLKGRMQYLERTSDTSLIIVEMRPASSSEALVQPGWSPLETAKSAIRGLAGFGQGLADVAITLAIFVPVWVPLAIAAWFAYRWLARRTQIDLPRRSAGPTASGQTPAHLPSAPSDSQ